VSDRELELLRGTLDVLILKTLSWGPAHGYAIASWIEEVTGNALSIQEGSLYPALHRLERRGWLESSWGTSENNRRAKYYALTDEGRRALRTESNAWTRFAEAVGMALGSTRAPEWGRGR
jgi:PadR family transcriptional regulator PadR